MNDHDDDEEPIWEKRLSAGAAPIRHDVLEQITKGYEMIVEGIRALGHDDASVTPVLPGRNNGKKFRDTPRRAAKGLLELILDKSAIDAEVDQLMSMAFHVDYKEMVISKHTMAFGVCPHHLLPVIYRISLGYIPTASVVGLSKLSRLARVCARAPVLQEELTHDLCRILHEKLESQGAAVYVEGMHMCMAARGVGSYEARVVTSACRGVFKELPLREEFIRLVTLNHPSVP